MADPWAKCDLDDWTAEEILANALLDPLPVGMEEDAIAVPIRPKKRAGWKDRWLSLV